MYLRPPSPPSFLNLPTPQSWRWAKEKNLAISMTKRTFLRPSDHRGWVLLCFAFYLLSQLIRGTTPTQEVLNSIPSTSSSIHFNTQISFPVAPSHAIRFLNLSCNSLEPVQWDFEIQANFIDGIFCSKWTLHFKRFLIWYFFHNVTDKVFAPNK